MSRTGGGSDGEGEGGNFLESEMADVLSSLLSGEGHTDAVKRWGSQCANPGTA